MKKDKSILLVDDDTANLATFRGLLESQGYSVDTAETGHEAVGKLNSQFYNLVVIDIRLPDMEGTQLLGKLQNQFPKTAKIILTGYPSLDNAIDSVNLDADAYLIKPVEPEHFLSVVEKEIEEQDKDERITEKKVTRWVRSRYLKLRRQRHTRQPATE